MMVVHLPSEPHLLKFAPGAPHSCLTIRPNLQIGGSPQQAVIYFGVKGSGSRDVKLFVWKISPFRMEIDFSSGGGAEGTGAEFSL